QLRRDISSSLHLIGLPRMPVPKILRQNPNMFQQNPNIKIHNQSPVSTLPISSLPISNPNTVPKTPPTSTSPHPLPPATAAPRPALPPGSSARDSRLRVAAVTFRQSRAPPRRRAGRYARQSSVWPYLSDAPNPHS